MSLYHYTCRHSLAKMKPDPYGYVTLQPLSPGGLLWLTDLDVPIRDALGLTNYIIDCDRAEYKLELLDLTTVQRWVDVRRQHSDLWTLERSPGAMPMHWFVSTSPERAKLVPSRSDYRGGDSHALLLPGSQSKG